MIFFIYISLQESSSRHTSTRIPAPRFAGVMQPNHHRRKTSLCKHYASNATCPYGPYCMVCMRALHNPTSASWLFLNVHQFAHGIHELLPPTIPPKYKTKPCRGYWVDGFCKYGEKCLFRHDDQMEEVFKPTISQKIICPKVEVTMDNIAKILHHVLELW